ncbi:hypothetical protein B0H11DRAFT_1905768 [Mycena galericulata]|nr:hypothetical protein B0H11DRAFT_1905768 [Mycena galericulata]
MFGFLHSFTVPARRKLTTKRMKAKTLMKMKSVVETERRKEEDQRLQAALVAFSIQDVEDRILSRRRHTPGLTTRSMAKPLSASGSDTPSDNIKGLKSPATQLPEGPRNTQRQLEIVPSKKSNAKTGVVVPPAQYEATVEPNPHTPAPKKRKRASKSVTVMSPPPQPEDETASESEVERYIQPQYSACSADLVTAFPPKKRKSANREKAKTRETSTQGHPEIEEIDKVGYQEVIVLVRTFSVAARHLIIFGPSRVIDVDAEFDPKQSPKASKGKALSLAGGSDLHALPHPPQSLLLVPAEHIRKI